MLAYGIEAVIPIEIGMPTHRVQAYDLARNEEVLRMNLDLLEVLREEVSVWLAVKEGKLLNILIQKTSTILWE